MSLALGLIAAASLACDKGVTVGGTDSGLCFYKDGDVYGCNCPWATCSIDGLEGSCKLTGLSIGLIVALVLMVLSCIAACVWCCCCRNKPQQVVMVQQPYQQVPYPQQTYQQMPSHA